MGMETSNAASGVDDGWTRDGKDDFRGGDQDQMRHLRGHRGWGRSPGDRGKR
jgi:hypothetical protein